MFYFAASFLSVVAKVSSDSRIEKSFTCVIVHSRVPEKLNWLVF